MILLFTQLERGCWCVPSHRARERPHPAHQSDGVCAAAAAAPHITQTRRWRARDQRVPFINAWRLARAVFSIHSTQFTFGGSFSLSACASLYIRANVSGYMERLHALPLKINSPRPAHSSTYRISLIPLRICTIIYAEARSRNVPSKSRGSLNYHHQLSLEVSLFSCPRAARGGPKRDGATHRTPPLNPFCTAAHSN